MNQLIRHKLTSALVVIIGVVLLVVPFHAFLTVWVSSLFGHYTALRLWDEVLLVLALIMATILSFYYKLWNQLKRLHVFWLILAYTLLELTLGLVAYLHHNVSAKALGYGLIVDLRFLGFFGICLIATSRPSWLKAYWRQLVLIPAAIVIVFGLAQEFALPYNFLQHFGYSTKTISPYETINHNLSYLRIMSSLRGANPLGAYLVIIVCVLTALIVTVKANRWRLTYGLFLLAALITLFFSYSRSAYAGALIGILIILSLHVRSPQIKRWGSLGLAVVVVFVAIAAFSLRHNTRLQNIFSHTQNNSAIKSTSNQGHVSALKTGLRDVLHQPLGRGPGTAGPASVYNIQPARNSENYYLQIAQEIGWLGLVLFVLINWLVAKGLWLLRNDPLAVALLAALVGITLINLFSQAWTDDTLSYLWWGLAGITLAPVLKRHAD